MSITKTQSDYFGRRIEKLVGQPFYNIFSQLLWLDRSDEQIGNIYDEILKRSMLHREVLIGYTALAAACEGPVLEIGPYVGGSTIALAFGARARGATVYALEKGGELDHSFIPTKDIFKDWKENVESFHIADNAVLVEGNYGNFSTVQEVRELVKPNSVGLFIQDADGHVDKGFNFAAEWLRPDCLLGVDDYEAGDNVKGAMTRPVIDKAVELGIMRTFGLFGSGTWFGQLADAESLVNGTTVFVRLDFGTDTPKGKRYTIELPYIDDFTSAGDDVEMPNRSPLLLLENGRVLGPIHSNFSVIETLGGGRFSHWGGDLHFSTLNDEDPRATDSQLELVFKDKRYELIVI